MSEMIERVARAINEYDGTHINPQPWHYDQTRAAI